MLRKGKNDLHSLIASLTPTEKGYFKKYMGLRGGKEDKKALLLFDLVNEMAEYDDGTLLKRASFTAVRQLPHLKKHLYLVLLKSLRSFHDGGSVRARIKAGLLEAEVLFNKQLFGQCSVLLEKCRDAGTRYEYFNELLDVYYWKLRMTTILSHEGAGEQALSLMEKEIKSVLQQNNILYQYAVLNARLFGYFRQVRYARTPAELQQMNALVLETPFFTDSRLAGSQRAKVYYHNTLGLYHIMGGNPDKSYEHFRCLFVMMDKDAFWKKETVYTTVILNLSVICSQLNKYDEALSLLAQIEAMPVRSQVDLNRVYVALNTRLDILLHTGRFEKALSMVPACEKLLSGSHFPRTGREDLTLYFNIGVAYLSSGDYGKSLHWINRLLNTGTPSEGIDVYGFAMLLRLVLHYEMQHFDVLPYLIKSTIRFLSVRRRLMRFEETVIAYLKKLPLAGRQEEILRSFSDLKNALEQLSSDPQERQAFGYFDLLSWLDSKLSGRTFTEVIRNKVKGDSRLTNA